MAPIMIVCPKCRRREEIKLNEFILRELHITGSANIAYYHSDHILYVNMDRYAIRTIATYDPPSMLIHGLNIYVDEYFVLRQPIIPNDMEIMFIDIKRKVADARLVSNHMYAVSLIRYLRINRKAIPEEGAINAYGVNYMIKRNGSILLAKKLKDDGDKAKNILMRLLADIKGVPVNLEKVLDIIL